MVDNDKDNDEYQFVDMDAAASPEEPVHSKVVDVDPKSSFDLKKYVFDLDVKKKALIVVVFMICMVILYKWLFPTDVLQKKSEAPKIAAVKPKTVPAVVAQVPVVTPSSEMLDKKIDSKLLNLEKNQQVLRSQFDSTNNQLNGIGMNLNELLEKMNELNRTVSDLSIRVQMQAQEIDHLTKRVASKPKVQVQRTSMRRVPVSPMVRYFIQAVIPGRAWLIATNGKTLTVREGTKIAGYGTVTLIDPRQGRILTTSGQVIRFSPEDS